MKVQDCRHKTFPKPVTARSLVFGGFYYGTVKGFYVTAKGLFIRTNGAIQLIGNDDANQQTFSLESEVEVVRVHGVIKILGND